MNDGDMKTGASGGLRARAEALLGRPAPAVRPEESAEDAVRLLHELRVHQIELELQNEELRAAQKRAEQSRDTYLRLFHEAPIGYVVTSPVGIIEEANETLGTMLGEDPAGLRGQPIAKLVYEPDLPVFLGRFRAFFHRPEGKTLEVRLRCRDARPFDAQIDGRATQWPLLADQGAAPAHVLLGVRDVTEKRRAERALQASEEEFRRLSTQFEGLLDALPDAVALLTRDLRCVWVNRAGAALAGRPGEALVGCPCLCGWWGRDVPCDGCPVLGAFATGSPTTHVLEPSPGLTLEVATVPLAGGKGDVEHVLAIVRDVTESRRLEEQARHAQKMEAVGRLAGGIAHDFNNLLTVVAGCAATIRDDAGPWPSLREDAEQILAAAHRAGDLTRRLLAFSRRQVLAPRVVDLGSVVAGLETLLRRLIGEHIALVVEPASAPIWVQVDPSQLEQVIVNLAVNARDAMPSGGALTLAVRRVPGGAAGETDEGVLTVRDTGSGMSEEVQRHLFEPFFTTKREEGGTGLGLATAYGIVRQHGGTIAVQSAPGSGAVFEIRLPLSEPPESTVEPTAEAPAAGRGELLLVVEDETAVRRVAVRSLRRAGYRVLEAADGPEALRIARGAGAAIALVVSDVVMPGMSGVELVAELRRERPELPVLYVSGYTRLAEIGAGDAFLQKPFLGETLRAKVRETLDRG